MTGQPGLMVCGLMVHALRGHLDSARLLLDSLDDTEVRTIALTALDGLALAVRSVDAGTTAEHIADSIQHDMYLQEGPQT